MKDRILPVSEFKAKCLRLLEDVAQQGNVLTITKRGQPIARVTPCTRSARSLAGTWKGSVRIRGDIVHFSTAEEWEANAE
jgi:prevent-host-death family protein